MSDINHQEFYEFFQQKVAENPQMSIEQAMTEFQASQQLKKETQSTNEDVHIEPSEYIKSNLNQEQLDRFITTDIQKQQGVPVH
ncbi:hypothetical protein [Moraxella sp. VT-16-12]|uniref:hypothetical protein n=1 Tax=Moraxella sp. VT-16-12 TaxID=2014877 RepID=UPI000B7DC757|nr:hypothetical protein [Moraxella sp. VT-16-12]TWV82464.1 hypothetical protein CEW93_006040 [Moraxella sp. VT-16-12]